MRNPFTTSFGTQQVREFGLIEVKNDEGLTGWGECVTSREPLYIEEFTESSLLMVEKFLAPLVLKNSINHPDELEALFKPFKRNNLAKSSIEGAIWDLYAKENNISLADALGGVQSNVEVGVSLGIESDINVLLNNIEEKVEEGYKRIKVKIKPGKDVDVVDQIRQKYPEIPLMVDANSAYTLEDTELLRKLDNYNLMMIEQPLASGDIIDHAHLQNKIKTPICLDESIHSYDDVRQAIEMGSCKIINLKVGRVGGLTQSKKIHELCKENNIPLWCGGMLESGIGRAHNIAITSLENFTLPGDTASSSRYWHKDIITPEVVVKHGVLEVPNGAGIGYEVNMDEVLKNTTDKITIKK